MRNLDIELFRALHRALSGRITLDVMAALSVLGGGWILILVGPLLIRATTRRLAASILGVAVTTTLAVFVIKRFVRRLRPCVTLPDVHARVFAAPTDFSFPSGHAAGSFALACFGVCLLLRRSTLTETNLALRAGLSALLLSLAFGVALSRIALGVHFPSDLAVGALLGSVIGTLFGLAYVRRVRS